MKRNIKTALLSLVLLLGLGSLSSCSSDNDNLNTTQSFTVPVTASQWKWNNEKVQYEATLSLPEYDGIYRNGSHDVYLFTNDNVEQPLPYSHTYAMSDNNNNPTDITETFNYNIQSLPNGQSNILFTIQSTQGSVLIEDKSYQPGNLTFKIVLKA